MDAALQLLKRQARASRDFESAWRYAHALERLVGSKDENSDLKLYQIMGDCGTGQRRCLFHCISSNEDGARRQFEVALKNDPSWGSVHWDFRFEDYDGPVEGVDQPFHLLSDEQLPIEHLSKYDTFLLITEVKLNTIEEFC